METFKAVVECFSCYFFLMISGLVLAIYCVYKAIKLKNVVQSSDFILFLFFGSILAGFFLIALSFVLFSFSIPFT